MPSDHNNMHAMTVSAAMVLLLLQACTTNLSKPEGPPQAPTKKFSDFEQIEMRHVQISPQFAQHEANQKAMKKIDEILFQQMAITLPSFREYDGKPGAPAGSTLIIEPYIKEIKFIGGAARFWAGALAGSSAVLMKVTFRDEATGAIVAEPEFYQKAAAMGGAWTFGATDNNMLTRICTLITEYTARGNIVTARISGEEG